MHFIYPLLISLRVMPRKISRLAYARSKRMESPTPFASTEASKKLSGEDKKYRNTDITYLHP
ncbi:MAG: hypothetical protein AMXMBFR12_06730 [Candidatus Babeliales bacterium]